MQKRTSTKAVNTDSVIDNPKKCEQKKKRTHETHMTQNHNETHRYCYRKKRKKKDHRGCDYNNKIRLGSTDLQ